MRSLLIIGVLALLVRVAVVAVTPDFAPLFDAADYQRHAMSIADGDGYPPPQIGGDGPSAFRPPLYPLALAVVQTVGGGLTAERLLGALLGVLSVVLLFEIARNVWDRRVAVVSAGLAAIAPPLVVLNASLLSEALFIPLVLAAVLAVLKYRESRHLRWAILAGAMCGLATLTRSNGLLLILAVVIGLWVQRPRLSRAALGAPVVSVLIMLVVLGPWTLRNALAFDRFVGVTTSTNYALAGTYNEESARLADHPGEPRSPEQLALFRPIINQTELDEGARIERLGGIAKDYVLDHPGYVLESVAWNVLRVFDIERRGDFKPVFQASMLQGLGVERLASPLYLVTVYALLALALVGLAAQAVKRELRRAPVFVWLAPVLMVLPALAVYGLARYRSPADPFIVLLAALGLVAVWDGTVRRSSSEL